MTDAQDALTSGELYLRTLADDDKGNAALGVFLRAKWPIIKLALEIYGEQYE